MRRLLCWLGWHDFKPVGIHSYACARCPAVEAGYP